jgi:hypothetical protein
LLRLAAGNISNLTKQAAGMRNPARRSDFERPYNSL